jgi:hypothetical protein
MAAPPTLFAPSILARVLRGSRHAVPATATPPQPVRQLAD